MRGFLRLTLTMGALLMPLFAVSEPLNCGSDIHIDCGNTPSATMHTDHSVWAVFEQNDHVYFTRSDDWGKNWSKAVAVNKRPEPIYTNGENRPKIALGNSGEIYVSWTEKTEGMYTGNIRFSRSLDAGVSFSEPVTVNNDGLLTSHRFDSLQVAESGKIYISWLDKRDQVTVRESGGDYTGAAFYFAVSGDQGASFIDNYKVADYSCECCRIASAPYRQDQVAVLWRHIFPGSIRDHASAILNADGSSSYARATLDDWKIEACPHHGPDITSAEGGFYHMVWFSNGSKQKGVYYGLQNFETGEGSQRYSVDSSASASHPQVARDEDGLYVAWKLFDGEKTSIQLIRSLDNGQNWSESESLLSTLGDSDHPQLIETQTQAYLAWHTAEEGYRIVAVN